MISVAMTTYNGEAFVGKQLESICNQSMPVDEIIICDDGSIDCTVEIIRYYMDNNPNIKLYINEKNLGYRENFKKALSLCQGEYIFLSDQDDIWMKDKVSEVIHKMHKNNAISVLATSFHYIDQNDTYINKENMTLYYHPVGEEELKQISFQELLLHNYFQGCCMCMKKHIKELYLQSYSDRIPHDWFINLIAANENGMYLWKKPLVLYRIHQHNTIGVETFKKSRFSWLKQEFTLEHRVRDLHDVLLALNALEKSNLVMNQANTQIITSTHSFVVHLLKCLNEKKIYKAKGVEKDIYKLFRTSKGRLFDFLYTRI